jgi:hypothetical protein
MVLFKLAALLLCFIATQISCQMTEARFHEFIALEKKKKAPKTCQILILTGGGIKGVYEAGAF